MEDQPCACKRVIYIYNCMAPILCVLPMIIRTEKNKRRETLTRTRADLSPETSLDMVTVLSLLCLFSGHLPLIRLYELLAPSKKSNRHTNFRHVTAESSTDVCTYCTLHPNSGIAAERGLGSLVVGAVFVSDSSW